MRSHIQTIRYSVQINDSVIQKVAIFNTNKLPTGMAWKCIEEDASNKYLLKMDLEQYVALFLDDGEFSPEFTVDESSESSEVASKELTGDELVGDKSIDI